jgi:hypothetical protein
MFFLAFYVTKNHDVIKLSKFIFILKINLKKNYNLLKLFRI